MGKLEYPYYTMRKIAEEGISGNDFFKFINKLLMSNVRVVVYTDPNFDAYHNEEVVFKDADNGNVLAELGAYTCGDAGCEVGCFEATIYVDLTNEPDMISNEYIMKTNPEYEYDRFFQDHENYERKLMYNVDITENTSRASRKGKKELYEFYHGGRK